jgi:hypothetical protein
MSLPTTGVTATGRRMLLIVTDSVAADLDGASCSGGTGATGRNGLRATCSSTMSWTDCALQVVMILLIGSVTRC